ncbi:hypothetical protein Lalb_Chr11g0070531 [Lupinus albus]|uniref:Uncharacterized protein n=1 Tax=Lupinus albus TaxID=3870 RepID=A0A6A4PRS4_LUPAL|nr:hypothetical protein Lalb_Chr11g0070531 [Lupinus albus]
MAAGGNVLRQILPEDDAAGELYVLALDDSHVDRKVIEHLLKISSCKGNMPNRFKYPCLSALFF